MKTKKSTLQSLTVGDYFSITYNMVFAVSSSSGSGGYTYKAWPEWIRKHAEVIKVNPKSITVRFEYYYKPTDCMITKTCRLPFNKNLHLNERCMSIF